MAFWDTARLAAGLAVEDLGNMLALPEMNISERIAGRSTPSTINRSVKASSPTSNYDFTQAKSPYNPELQRNNIQKPLGTLSGSANKSTVTNYVDPLSNAADETQSEADAYLQALNTEYDLAAEELRGQLSQASADREVGLSSLQSAVDEYGNLISKQKMSAQQAAEKGIQSAGSTARQTQGKSRNVLRALGILSSSAAGDILNRPMTEFGTQKAELQQGLIQRNQELDDALAQKTAEHANLVKGLENQYAQIVGNIQRDLRFSDRERADAVAAAKAAVLSRLSEIRTAQANWQNEINAAKQGLSASTANLGAYTNPTADISRIANTGLTTTQQYKPTTQTASIYGDRQKRLTDLTPNNYT